MYLRYVPHERVNLMARRMLAMILLSILVVILCECVKDKEKDQAKDIPGEVDKARAITGKDGAEMVLIPAGEFEMGTDPAQIPELAQWAKKYYSVEASRLERGTPRHKVYLNAFYIDVYEVTNAHYKKFMDATGHSAPSYWNDSRFNAPNQPVVGVSWHDAVAYAEWAGKRLPTEAEWEKAARGGLVDSKFPWGDTDPDGTQCNFADNNTSRTWSDKNADDGHEYAAPVGSYPPNGYGLYDMAGNVWEWCADWYDWYDGNYYVSSPYRNPKGPDSGSYRVLRGGSYDLYPYDLRVAYRDCYNPTGRHYTLGFRCAGH